MTFEDSRSRFRALLTSSATRSDMAIFTGGQVIAEELGLELENVTVKNLGTASGIWIDS